MGSRRISVRMHRDIVTLPSGTSLEYVLFRPAQQDDAPEGNNKLAVCLHPWSWLGGRMTDPVLDIVAEPLLERGYQVLRYNSRGVGKSKGWPSLTGSKEVEDLQELVEWARSSRPNLSKLVILGYSHGSLIASMHPVLPDVDTAHMLLSYPLGPRQWLTAFHSHRYATTLKDLVCNSRSHVLIIYGDQDDFTSVESYDSWANVLRGCRAEKEQMAAEPGELKIVKITGASHFWREQQAVERLNDLIKSWVP
ncbi:alpha/beta-hydrolase [Trametes coccinea BRFM310]|uniref:Alpha/beta-hydrolase n=1 Tax=Trametes coccinea (strain BRFM310) TaxID=1353009 RepID=A0A1Y2I6V6_TRAC3|nr:alpha/beta-hydrolase [Trametes coccinea BRFM310]